MKRFGLLFLAVFVLVFSLNATVLELQAGVNSEENGVEAQLFQATGCAPPFRCIPSRLKSLVDERFVYCRRVALSCGDQALACVQCVQELNITRAFYLFKQVANGSTTALAELQALVRQAR